MLSSLFRSRVSGLLLLSVGMEDALYCGMSPVLWSQATLPSQGPFLVVVCVIYSCIWQKGEGKNMFYDILSDQKSADIFF